MNIDFKFYAITDRKKTGKNDFLAHIEKACASGLRIIQVREKDLPKEELLRLCEEIRHITIGFHTKVLINDRVDIALELDLDGIHLTEKSLPAGEVRKAIGNGKLIGVSTHSIEALKKAELAGADFVVLGPVESTSSKPAGHSIMTAEEFSAACTAVTIPVFALGGIHLNNIKYWLDHGAHGVAGISIWIEAEDIGKQLKQLEKCLGHL